MATMGTACECMAEIHVWVFNLSFTGENNPT
jgi:hypothetical protein